MLCFLMKVHAENKCAFFRLAQYVHGSVGDQGRASEHVERNCSETCQAHNYLA